MKQNNSPRGRVELPVIGHPPACPALGVFSHTEKAHLLQDKDAQWELIHNHEQAIQNLTERQDWIIKQLADHLEIWHDVGK